MTLQSRRRLLSRRKTLSLLDEMGKTAADAVSLYLPPGSEAASPLDELNLPPEILPEATGLASASATGATVFRERDKTWLILPPFPIAAGHSAGKLDTGPLRSLLERDYTIALVLVRLGSYAVGVCAGEKLAASKVGTGNIHGRHRKGGSSAHRFERHRDKQIEYFFTRLCQHAREHIEPHAKALDYIVYGGARTTIQLLLKQCDFLAKLTAPELPPLLDIAEPRLAVLEKAIDRVWSSTIIEWGNTE